MTKFKNRKRKLNHDHDNHAEHFPRKKKVKAVAVPDSDSDLALHIKSGGVCNIKLAFNDKDVIEPSWNRRKEEKFIYRDNGPSSPVRGNPDDNQTKNFYYHNFGKYDSDSGSDDDYEDLFIPISKKGFKPPEADKANENSEPISREKELHHKKKRNAKKVNADDQGCPEKLKKSTKCDAKENEEDPHHESTIATPYLSSVAKAFVLLSSERNKEAEVTKTKRVQMKQSMTNEKPFNCKKCQKGFWTKGKLRFHERIHNNDLPRPHKCERCPKQFTRETTLYNHMKNLHGVILSKREKRNGTPLIGLVKNMALRSDAKRRIKEYEDHDKHQPVLGSTRKPIQKTPRKQLPETPREPLRETPREPLPETLRKTPLDIPRQHLLETPREQLPETPRKPLLPETRPCKISLTRFDDPMEPVLGYLFSKHENTDTTLVQENVNEDKHDEGDWIYPFIFPDEVLNFFDFDHFILSNMSGDDDFEAIQEEDDDGAIGNEEDYLIGKGFLTEDSFDKTRKQAKFDCVKCRKQFNFAIGFTNHIRKFHWRTSLWSECMECEEEFKSPHRMVAHMNRHTGDRPFKCLKCPRTFVGISGFKYHMKYGHTKKKPAWIQKTKKKNIKKKTTAVSKSSSNIIPPSATTTKATSPQVETDVISRNGLCPNPTEISPKASTEKSGKFNFLDQALRFVNKMFTGK